jgi:hypothetical protein
VGEDERSEGGSKSENGGGLVGLTIERGTWRWSKTRWGPRRLGCRLGRDVCTLGHGRRREGVAGGAFGAESNGAWGKIWPAMGAAHF